MKRLLYLVAMLVTVSTTAKTVTSTGEVGHNTIANFVRGYGNSFIFSEGGIEFSVFQDGQFDFYMPNYGPSLNVGINSAAFALSFNAGYDYNPYVQYDSFGAIIQIENTPVFYDYYGRVNQIGNIFINYNGFGRVVRIGGLNIYYRNNAFWRYDGYINVYNRGYIWRPWHRFYTVPPANFCVINTWPYRQFYTPVRHIWYRPYRNNIRYHNVYGRRGDNRTLRRDRTHRRNTYAQVPRNRSERNIQSRMERRNSEINSTRNASLTNNDGVVRSRTERNSSVARNRSAASSDGNRLSSQNSRRDLRTSGTRPNRNIARTTKRSNSRTASLNRSESRSKVARNGNKRQNINKKRAYAVNKRTTTMRKQKGTPARSYDKARNKKMKKHSLAQNKRKSSSVTSRPRNSRSDNKKASRSKTRRTR